MAQCETRERAPSREFGIPYKQSFTALFSDLGFKNNMLRGEDISMCYEKWRITDLEILEHMMCYPPAYLCQGKEAPWLPLRCPVKNAKQSGDRSFSMDYVENPSITTKNGITFTFTKAKFEDKKFIVGTTIKLKKGATFKGEYTIFSLRGMLANELKPSKKNCLSTIPSMLVRGKNLFK